MTVEIIEKSTNIEKVAVYAPNSRGNMRYNVDGTFYTDKQFDRLFEIKKTANKKTYWRSHVRLLFEEILESNDKMQILDKPLRITLIIMGEIAAHAVDIQDEKLMAICGRLGLYEGCLPTEPNYKEMQELISKYF